MEDSDLDPSMRYDNLSDICTAAALARGILDDITSFEMVEEGGCHDVALGTFRTVFHFQDEVVKSPEILHCKQPVTISSKIDSGHPDFSSSLGLILDDRRIERVFQNIYTLYSSYCTLDSTIDIRVSYEMCINMPTADRPHPGRIARVTPLPFGSLDASTIGEQISTNINSQKKVSKLAESAKSGIAEDAVEGNVIVEYFCSAARVSSVDWSHIMGDGTSFLDASRLVGGSGLGLRWRLSQDIIRRHGGRLVVRSGRGDRSGLFVQVCLPVVRRQYSASEVVENNEAPHATCANPECSDAREYRECKVEESDGGAKSCYHYSHLSEYGSLAVRLESFRQTDKSRGDDACGLSQNGVAVDGLECSTDLFSRPSAVDMSSRASTNEGEIVKWGGADDSLNEAGGDPVLPFNALTGRVVPGYSRPPSFTTTPKVFR
eukprot:gene1381-1573_t